MDFPNYNTTLRYDDSQKKKINHANVFEKSKYCELAYNNNNKKKDFKSAFTFEYNFIKVLKFSLHVRSGTKI